MTVPFESVIGLPGIVFGDSALYQEFTDPRRTDPRLRALLLELGLFAALNGRQLRPTQIFRSRESQIAIYGQDKPSGHRELPARAIDISIGNLGGPFVVKLLNHFESYLKIGPFFSLICHDVGAGAHLHLQVPRASHNVPADDVFSISS